MNAHPYPSSGISPLSSPGLNAGASRGHLMKIERVDLDFVEIPLKTPFQTSYGGQAKKTTFIITVYSEGLLGYSESVAEVHPLYTEETHASLYFCLKNDLWPRLIEKPLSSPHEVYERFKPVRGNRMAKAAIEMAIWDWWARRLHQPLYQLLGGDVARRKIPVGVSIGILPTIQDLLRASESYLSEGYRRLKIKIKPGWDLEPLTALRKAVGENVLIMADANSAYGLDDAPHLQLLDPLHLLMIEQPLAPNDFLDHRELAKKISTPICLDEAIVSENDARWAAELGACSFINLKTGRVGGYTEALKIHDVTFERGVPIWCGGMLETGIGRAHNLHLSTLPNFQWPGDTSASDRYFAKDLIDPPFRLNGDGTLTVPEGPGIGVQPDAARLRQYTTYHETWRLQDVFVGGGLPHGTPTSF